MKRNSIPLILAAVCVLGGGAPIRAADGSSPAREEEKKLLGVLASEAPLFEKAKACQRLAVVGTKDAVPALAKLLTDEKLAHYARFGLEPIPDAAVDEALRAALGTLQGKLLVGVINSIGTRRDAAAEDALVKFLAGTDVDVASAAAAALGRIGTPRAGRSLWTALGTSGEKLLPAVADAGLVCAERLLAGGKQDAAVSLYDALRAPKNSENIRVAALKGAILARGDAGVALLVETMGGEDTALFDLALGVARSMPAAGTTAALVAELPKLPPDRRSLVIGALGDRGDAAALPAVLEAAKSGPARVAALRALRRLGGAASVPVLIGSAADADATIAEEARATLTALEGKEIDAAIAGMLAGSEGTARSIVIDLAGRRRLVGAVPALRSAADAEDEAVRLAALKALGNTIGLEDVPFLAARVISPKTPKDAAAALEALKAASVRMPDRDAASAKLLECMEKAPAEPRASLIEVFVSLGGAKALEAVSAAFRAEDARIRDAAVRALGDWKSEDAGTAILALAQGAASAPEKTRALGAFRDLYKKLGFPKERKVALLAKALKCAESTEDTKIMIEAFVGVPAAEAYPLLLPYLAKPEVKEEAAEIAVTIGERMVRFAPAAVAEAMKQVIPATGRKELADRAAKLYTTAGGK